MSKKDKDKDDKKVTIFVVHTACEEDDEDDDFFPSDDEEDDAIVQKKYLTRSKKEVVKNAKIPLSKRFLINKGKPVTDLKSLIEAFKHVNADAAQKEFVETLIELNNMIGMASFKEQIINQILFFIQDFQEPGIFLHTVLTGPPGCGKTSAINILAKIYSKLGILETNQVVHADRANLIGKYLGHTAMKTKAVLESAKGKILVIDEVYSLGNKDHSDTYSKECMDTLNQYLSEHVDEFICVIAGYKDLVDDCFFGYNPGLDRRFPWRFTIDAYKHDELSQIMCIQVKSSGWKFEDNMDSLLSHLILDNKDYFKGNGGDTKNFIDKCKIAHARRVFTIDPTASIKKRRKERVVKKGVGPMPSPSPSPQLSSNIPKILNKEDIENGLRSFKESKKKEEETSYLSMYS